MFFSIETNWNVFLYYSRSIECAAGTIRKDSVLNESVNTSSR